MDQRLKTTVQNMFSHYLKMALRNIRKYALQNTVSVIGLAAGFVCLSLSSVWLYYENSFDSFHKDADRIYTLNIPSTDADAAKGSLPETGNLAIMNVAEVIGATETTLFVISNHENPDYREIKADTAFYNIFDIKLLRGDWSFMRDDSKVAITAKYAEKVFAGLDPLEQVVDGRVVAAVVEGLKPSVLDFDVISYREPLLSLESALSDNISVMDIMKLMNNIRSSFFMKVPEGVDAKQIYDNLRKSDNAVAMISMAGAELMGHSIDIVSIRDLHQVIIRDSSYVSIRTMRFIFIASLLVMICSLVNILIFFMNTIRGRNRESALRKVHGATTGSLIGMFSTEMSVIVMAGLILGMVTVWVLKDSYISVVDISMPGGFLLGFSLMLMAAVFVISVLLCIICINAIKRWSLNGLMADTNRKGLFSKFSVALQLFAGTLFAFITCVMIHQLQFLRNRNWGLKVNDQVVLTMSPADASSILEFYMTGAGGAKSESEINAAISRMEDNFSGNYQSKVEGLYGISAKLRAIPSVTQVLDGIGDLYSLREGANSMRYKVVKFMQMNGIDSCEYSTLDVLDEKELELLNLEVLDGEIPHDRPILENEIVITENLWKKLGLAPVSEGPVISIQSSVSTGQVLQYAVETNNFKVIAVVKDIKLFDYTESQQYLVICTPGNPKLVPKDELTAMFMSKPQAVFLIRYEHGSKKEVWNKVTQLLDDTGCNYELSFTEDRFFKGLDKETHLMNLIMVLGVICSLISIFGIWSMINLACRERRREIAVRKVHGAKVSDILGIFIREYGMVVVSSMVTAFIAGFLVMHHWIQRFPCQATISWWIYAGIFFGTILVICLTVVHKVLRTAGENPADVIKSE